MTDATGRTRSGAGSRSSSCWPSWPAPARRTGSTSAPAGSGPATGPRPTQPAAVAPPPGLTLPAAVRAGRRRRARATAPAVRPGQGAARRWRRCLNDKDLGRRVFAVVADLDGGQTRLHRRRPVRRSPRPRPSCSRRPRRWRCSARTTTFETRVVRGGGAPDRPGRRRRPAPGPQAGRRRRLAPPRRHRRPGPADRGRAARAGPHAGVPVLRRLPVHRPGGQPALAAPTTCPTASSRRSPRCGSTRAATRPGFGRVADPSATAADEFADLLGRFGIKVTGRARRAARARRRRRAGRGRQRAAVRRSSSGCSTVSDNEAAEVLARQVGLAVSDEGSFEAGVAGRAPAPCAGSASTPTAPRIYDGSGLSRDEPARPRDPGRRAPGGRGAEPPRARRDAHRAARRRLHRLAGGPVRGRADRRAAAWCAPRPAPSPGSARWPARSPTRTARRWCSR